MLAFPVAKLESVRINHQGATTLLVSPNAAPVGLPIRSAHRHLEPSFNHAVLNLQSAEFNLQIRELEHSATYRKHMVATRSIRQEIQKCSQESSSALAPSKSAGVIRLSRGLS